MNTLISVVGPTASGKTSFALRLAQQAIRNLNNIGTPFFTGVDLISVDSRQVYKGLEILSGADVPESFSEVVTAVKPKFFQHESLPIRLHGVSIISLTDEWSVAHFKDFATKIILDAWQNQRLPILVGGTGLYHQQLFQSDAHLYVPPSQDIRDKAAKMNFEQLQSWTQEVAPEKFEHMNNSDRNNPRRLIRAIEIATGTPETTTTQALPSDVRILKLGMQVELDELEEKIKSRVQERFDSGALPEVSHVLDLCAESDLQVCSTLGVKDIAQFLSGEISQEECLQLWSLHEFQYAKRQYTWFRKQPDITWLDSREKKQYTLSNEKTFLQ